MLLVLVLTVLAVSKNGLSYNWCKIHCSIRSMFAALLGVFWQPQLLQHQEHVLASTPIAVLDHIVPFTSIAALGTSSAIHIQYCQNLHLLLQWMGMTNTSPDIAVVVIGRDCTWCFNGCGCIICIWCCRMFWYSHLSGSCFNMVSASIIASRTGSSILINSTIRCRFYHFHLLQHQKHAVAASSIGYNIGSHKQHQELEAMTSTPFTVLGAIGFGIHTHCKIWRSGFCLQLPL